MGVIQLCLDLVGLAPKLKDDGKISSVMLTDMVRAVALRALDARLASASSSPPVPSSEPTKLGSPPATGPTVSTDSA